MTHLADYQQAMPAPYTLRVPGTRGAQDGGRAVAISICAGVALLATYLLLRPPLYNYDGYIYRLEALAPADGGNINPHHLLWYPLQKALALAGSALGSTSPEAFQLFGVVANALALALLCLLLMRLTNRRALPVAMTVFVAFSPYVWKLGMQNQPYPLLDLAVVAFLWTLTGRGVPSRGRFAAGGLALAAAVMLQQAMLAVIPAVAFGLAVAGEGRFKNRLKAAAGWAAATLAAVATIYILMTSLAGVHLRGFLGWTTMYLQEQHGIQLHWPQSAIRSAIGLVSTLLESSLIRESFNPGDSGEAYWRFYGGILAAGCLGVAGLLRRRSARARLMRLWRTDAPFTAACMMVLAWGAFAFLWEPAGYYWCVLLFPLAFLASWWVRGASKRTARVIIGVLLAASAWNLYADHRLDRVSSVNYPPPLLEEIRAELGPADVFIVAGRDWYANLDYSLLLACLDNWPQDPAWALLDDYVMKDSSQAWQQRLDRDLRESFAAGGRVYLADHVLRADTYRDLEQATDPFAEYTHVEYAKLDGEDLRDSIRAFFGRYRLGPSRFKIGPERFWEVKAAP